NSAGIRVSPTRQKEPNGSSESSACELDSPVAPQPCAPVGSSCTNSTSQSAHRVNPCRYSALHCGQYIAPSLLHPEFQIATTRVETSPLFTWTNIYSATFFLTNCSFSGSLCVSYTCS